MSATCLLLAGSLSFASPIVDLHSWMQEVKKTKALSDEERDVQLEWISLLKSRLSLNASAQSEDLVKATQKILEDEASAERKLSSRVLPFAQQMVRIYQQVRERNEEPLVLMKSYLNFGGILQPGDLDAFADSRAYLNGKETMAAQMTNREELGLSSDSEEPSAEDSSDEQSSSETELPQPFQTELTPKTGKFDTAKRESNIGADKIVPGKHSSLEL